MTTYYEIVDKYTDAYRKNEHVKDYVDKYSTCHGIEPCQALKHLLVRNFIDYEINKKEK